LEELYFKIPLYKKITISDEDVEGAKVITDIFDYNGLIDGYNPEINENTSYQVNFFSDFRNSYSIDMYCGIHKCRLKCVRTGFIITYFFLLEEIEDEKNEKVFYTLQKIGQFPTIADLEIGRYKRFSKVISKENLREFNKSIGLAANGVGVGSFVYLRRIFENLLELHHQNAKKIDNWDDNSYKNGRITDKIELLKSELPEAVVKYKNVYSIISKGIHELDEQECLKYFPIVKDAIVAILEQDYLKRKNKDKQEELEKSIQKATGELK
jgi:hypothetical protein